MARDNISNLLALIAVARHGSFTRAGVALEVSQSALSRTIRGLEEAVGVRLLHRTTRSVKPTEAGERLIRSVEPNFTEIEAELATITELSEQPAGTIRISSTDFLTDTILWPRLFPLLQQYPDIKIEFTTNYKITDIVAERYDFGVRVGSQVAKDMIAVRLSPDFRRVIVGAPSYFEKHAPPRTPDELATHIGITMRLASSGGQYAWPLKKGRRKLQARIGGQLIFNNTYQIINAAVSGCGLAFTPEPLVQEHVREGRLRCVLDEWSPTSPGFFLYYPSRRQQSRASSLVIEALRHRTR